ncbi:MAG: serine/threonine protein kinase [Planctomycetes bacterium]|nr:serine/threonine protein kinase [Planctomycetota bacterium]
MENREDVSFGAIAIRLGLATSDQIAEAVKLQARAKALGGATRKLGEILVERRVLTEDDIKQIFRVQGLKGGHTQIAGYRLLHKIGHGSMGAVYKAIQCSMDRPVALKVLRPALAQNRKFVERFFREARAVARLNHPNIVQGIDVGESNGVHYFVMEYLDGYNVGTHLERGGAMEEKRAAHIVLQIARALEHAQEHGMIHRDVKPDNILVTRAGVAKLCDLGLAKLLDRPTADATDPGASMGTPNYISPEQARGEANVDIRTDIYSLGGTLYHMLTGQVPFPLENAMEVISKHLTEAPPPPRAIQPTVSAELDFVVARMMSKDRALRHPTPAALVADLQAVLAGGKPEGFDRRPQPPGPAPSTRGFRVPGSMSSKYLSRRRRFRKQ